MARKKRTEAEIAAERRDRFVRVAEKRTQSVLDAIESLSACADKGMYEYTSEDAVVILDAINEKVAKLRQTFIEGGPPRFRLD